MTRWKSPSRNENRTKLAVLFRNLIKISKSPKNKNPAIDKNLIFIFHTIIDFFHGSVVSFHEYMLCIKRKKIRFLYLVFKY